MISRRVAFGNIFLPALLRSFGTLAHSVGGADQQVTLHPAFTFGALQLLPAHPGVSIVRAAVGAGSKLYFLVAPHPVAS